jgi:hypothetical protein
MKIHASSVYPPQSWFTRHVSGALVRRSFDRVADVPVFTFSLKTHWQQFSTVSLKIEGTKSIRVLPLDNKLVMTYRLTMPKLTGGLLVRILALC